MAGLNFYLCFLMPLIGVNLIRADEESHSRINGGGRFPFLPNMLTGNGGGIPFLPPMASNFIPPIASNFMPPMPSNIMPPLASNFMPPMASNFMPPMASNFMPPFLSGSRTERSPNDEERTANNGTEDDSQQRLFFPTATRISCDYSDETQRGSQCLSCTQVVRCYRSNIGILRTCRGLLPYCNNGRCSFTRGELCEDGF